MKLSSTIAIAALLAAAQGSALAAEVAVLRNGFAIRCERREQIGDMMRLYTTSGYIDVPASEITAFEKDDTPAASILASPMQAVPVTTSGNPTTKAFSQPLQPGIKDVSSAIAITPT